MKVLSFPLCEAVISAFREYDSFLEIGYDVERQEGLDLAFYRDKKLVFFVISHEDMGYLEDEFKGEFKDTIL